MIKPRPSESRASVGIMRRPAWQASLAGLIVGLIIATGVWSLPVNLAMSSVANGVVFALWPSFTVTVMVTGPLN